MALDNNSKSLPSDQCPSLEPLGLAKSSSDKLITQELPMNMHTYVCMYHYVHKKLVLASCIRS